VDIFVSRIIHQGNPGGDRKKLLQLIGIVLRELGNSTSQEAINIDIYSYIALLLYSIDNSVEATAVSWEKREYWLKVDQFRKEWEWVGVIKTDLVDALRKKDLNRAGLVSKQLQAIVSKIVTVPSRKNNGINYQGSWEILQKKLLR
jgi:hypothetical protein